MVAQRVQPLLGILQWSDGCSASGLANVPEKAADTGLRTWVPATYDVGDPDGFPGS